MHRNRRRYAVLPPLVYPFVQHSLASHPTPDGRCDGDGLTQTFYLGHKTVEGYNSPRRILECV